MLSVDEMKSKYPDKQLYRVPITIESEDGQEIKKEFYFEKPKTIDIDRLLKEIGTRPSVAIKNYLLGLVLEECRTDLEAVFREYPMLHTQIADKLNGLAGGNAFVDLKKL
ncbi:MAG: hypothetical protein QMC95_06545 [Desulfitobacteriaceae bacterium]|nr:hypothetical protein [Desulfitobacteriaceae bacterium]